MAKNPTRNEQAAVDLFADFCWQWLTDFYDTSKRKRPPIHLYLSPQSRGSLRGRSEEETAWVHWAQVRDGGMTLKSPPAAWVAQLSQVPEEVTHLFCLVYQKFSMPKQMELVCEARATCLHECFGRLSHQMILGPSHGLSKAKKNSLRKSQISSARNSTKLQPSMKEAPRHLNEESFWDFCHSHGYRLAEKLALQAFADPKLLSILRKVFRMNWYTEKQQSTALSRLYKASGSKPPAGLAL